MSIAGKQRPGRQRLGILLGIGFARISTASNSTMNENGLPLGPATHYPRLQ
jgi:hypothetical protein